MPARHTIAPPWRGRTALVTGASSGIGLAIARRLAADGCHLVLTARRRERLDALRRELTDGAGVRVDVVPADLADADGARRVAEAIDAAGRDVDLLINNAGIGIAGAFAATPWERDRQLAQLNMVSVLELTKHFLQPMLARRRGHVVFVASVVAYMPVPLMAHYAASKAFVRSFAEALAYETRGTGVHVTLVSPGSTATEFFETAGYGQPVTGAGALVQTADRVAEATLAAMAAGRRVLVPGLANRIMALSGRLLPAGLVMRLADRIQRSRL